MATNNSPLKYRLLEHSLQTLGEQFYSSTVPTLVKKPEFIRVNKTLASELGLDAKTLESNETLQLLAGNDEDLPVTTIASVYAGHQFGHWNPQLGDGRAIYLGELKNHRNQLLDVQLKGSGTTRFSRMGDGRSPVGPVLREYLLSETMFALGIPTTRALAAVTTGERVVRDQLEPGAILTRVAASHVRVGTFQYFSARGDLESIQHLADYVIDRHYAQDVAQHGLKNPYAALFDCAVKRQALLIAHWMSVGFIHGVMNTDNMLVSGDTIDFGPCAFLDEFNSKKVFSSIDRGGRYAYCNQPTVAKWNLSWLGQALLPLMGEEQEALATAQQSLDNFDVEYNQHYDRIFAEKLGFNNASSASQSLTQEFLDILERHRLDFTNSFRNLGNILGETLLEGQLPQAKDQSEKSEHTETPKIIIEREFLWDKIPDELQSWITRWLAELTSAQAFANKDQVLKNVEQIRSVNPAIIPRNHWVNRAIEHAKENNDFSLFHTLADVLEKPFEYREAVKPFTQPPTESEVVLRTFCGT